MSLEKQIIKRSKFLISLPYGGRMDSLQLNYRSPNKWFFVNTATGMDPYRLISVRSATSEKHISANDPSFKRWMVRI